MRQRYVGREVGRVSDLWVMDRRRGVRSIAQAVGAGRAVEQEIALVIGSAMAHQLRSFEDAVYVDPAPLPVHDPGDSAHSHLIEYDERKTVNHKARKGH